jgi:hypothetical protein
VKGRYASVTGIGGGSIWRLRFGAELGLGNNMDRVWRQTDILGVGLWKAKGEEGIRKMDARRLPRS